MKKTFTFLVIVVLSLTATISVFSQKTKSLSVKKINTRKELPQPTIKSDSNVKLSSAEAFSDGNGVFLKWQAESETKNLGFFVYRIGEKGAELVSPSIV